MQGIMAPSGAQFDSLFPFCAEVESTSRTTGRAREQKAPLAIECSAALWVGQLEIQQASRIC